MLVRLLTVDRNDAASKIQDIAAKKLERLEAQKITNELRNQRASQQEHQKQPDSETTVTDDSSEPTASKPNSSRFVESKRQAVEENKLTTKSTSEKDTFNIDDDDEALMNFKPGDLKIKIQQDSFRNPAAPLKKKVGSNSSVDASPLGSKGSSRSVNTDSSGGGSARNLDKKDGKTRFEKRIRRGSIKNHSSLMAPEVDHDDLDGEFTFDVKSEFGVSDAHLEVAKALSPKPPDQPQDSDFVPSTRKKSLRVIDPVASAAASAAAAVESVSPKSQKLSQKIKRKPTSPGEDKEVESTADVAGSTTEERVSTPKRSKSIGEGLKASSVMVAEGEDVSVSAVAMGGGDGGGSMSSKMKPVRRKSRRAGDAVAAAEEAEEGATAVGAESNSGKSGKTKSEDKSEEPPAEKPPKLKISKSARVRSVGSTPNVASDVTPLLDGSDANTSSKNRLMSVDDIASPSSSVVIATKESLPAVKKPHKPKIKLPELVPHEKRAGAAAVAAIESSSDRKRRSVVEHDEYDEDTGAIKKRKPLFMRIIARANRQKQEEERQRVRTNFVIVLCCLLMFLLPAE